MTTATDRRPGARGATVRCAWAVVVALLAALAVLVHHETTSAAMPAPAVSAMPGMDHTAAAMAQTTPSAGHDTAPHAMNTGMRDGRGACSGAPMQHCSTADLGTAKLAPPPAAAHTARLDHPHAAPAGQSLPGTPYRAPPDLSVLSRLLI